MDRIPDSPPIIPPVALDVKRPRWSVMIPAYNCSKYLADAITSVLMQNIPEEQMQIEVIDDASTDADVAALVEGIGKGRVKYFRQQVNVGSLRNFETCIKRSTGEIVHLLHGDDRVKPGYYQRLGELFDRYPEIGAACCGYNYINEDGVEKFAHTLEMNNEGILENWLYKIAEACSVQYVSMVVKREVYERLGSFYGLIYGEDWEMWVRMAQYYKVAYTPQILADYRIHEQSITGLKMLNGGVLKDTRQVIERIQHYLPEQQRAATIKKTRRRSAIYGLQIAKQVWSSTRKINYVNANARQILAMSFDSQTIRSVSKLYLQIIMSSVQKLFTRK